MEVQCVPVSADTINENWLKKVLAVDFGLSVNDATNRIHILEFDVSADKIDGFFSRMQGI